MCSKKTIVALILLCFFVFLAGTGPSYGEIEVEMGVAQKQVYWGENAEFFVKITNKTNDSVRIDGLRFGPYRPDLKLINSKGTKIIRRTGGTGPRVVFGRNPCWIEPGKSYTGRFLLNYDVESCGNLPIGPSRLIVVDFGSLFDGKSYRPLKIQKADGVKLKVLNPKRINQEDWVSFLKSNDLTSKSPGQQLSILRGFLDKNPSAPMSPTIRYNVIKILRSKFIRRPIDKIVVKNMLDLANQNYRSDQTPDLLKLISYEEILKSVKNSSLLGDEVLNRVHELKVKGVRKGTGSRIDVR